MVTKADISDRSRLPALPTTRILNTTCYRLSPNGTRIIPKYQ
jgi:hypothetical protein